MGDADGAGAGEQDLEFGLEKGLVPDTSMQELRDAAFSYRSDPMTGKLTGGPAGARGEARGADITIAPTVAPEISTVEPIVPPKEEVPAVTEEPKKPAKEKPEKEKPVITRAKRRRSLLTEEEGGVLRSPAVYRRSILGR